MNGRREAPKFFQVRQGIHAGNLGSPQIWTEKHRTGPGMQVHPYQDRATQSCSLLICQGLNSLEPTHCNAHALSCCVILWSRASCSQPSSLSGPRAQLVIHTYSRADTPGSAAQTCAPSCRRRRRSWWSPARGRCAAPCPAAPAGTSGGRGVGCVAGGERVKSLRRPCP